MTVPDELRINAQLAIPRREFRFTFVRSSGPGGQNVNKVASKAVLRWSITASEAISEPVRTRLLSKVARQINDRGELILTSQRYRDQGRNVDDCLEKLRTIVLNATKVPKRRKKTRPTKSSREARLGEKRVQSEKKRRRTPPTFD